MKNNLFLKFFVVFCVLGVLYVKFVAPTEATTNKEVEKVVTDIKTTLTPPKTIEVPVEENIPLSNVKPVHEPIIFEADYTDE